jgi:hypothetical protein
LKPTIDISIAKNARRLVNIAIGLDQTEGQLVTLVEEKKVIINIRIKI